MPENAKKPQIRFKGFTDAWEQRKLGEIAETYSGGTPSVTIKKYYIGNIPFIRSAEINSKNTELFINEDALLYSSAKRVSVGDILYALYGATSGEVGRAALNGAINQAVLAILPQKNYDSEYLMQWLCKSKFKIIGTFLQGGQGNLSAEIVKNLNIDFPIYKEQIIIGIFLHKLDNLITLHQRKLDKLKNIKKSMLEKMFPKNGSNIPEIRFTGFTDAWEQRKLNNYLIVSDEKNSENLYKKEDVLSVSGDFGIVNQIEFQGRSFAGTSVLNYGVVHKGDVVYTKSPLKATPYGIIKTNKGSTGIVSVLYGVYHTKENANADFIQVYFEQNARLNNYLRPLVNKGAKNTLLISDEEALNGEVNFAPSLNEQLKISVVFNSIDNLITLHQRKLEKLQNIKKACLEKMFV